ncbi:phytoene/squalene synthase family protein [uncultured Maribacter sp.]|uniref:phytoene/squalene synthase family protein n=1 Tax=uncultured Maribacter sp. TaxID=431308 RepID=UPI00262503D6|nr:phytoene/squalene synthase family protein [uncultured Maribacter sp.]
MKKLYTELSFSCSKLVTKKYSTSFSSAVRMLSPKIRSAIYSVYGFVRFADEIVDSFHEHNQQNLLKDFEDNYYEAHKNNISLNPILHSFQKTVKKYKIEDDLIQAFLKSMRADLHKTTYHNKKDYEEYIYGSADVVGLMCLKIFTNGDIDKYNALKAPAMRLGSAFQKVNFLRDIKEDYEVLNRSYFPNVNLKQLSPEDKLNIIEEIKEDFKEAYKGVVKLPLESRFGVYTAYRYYLKLLRKLERTPSSQIMDTRIRISDLMKFNLLAKSFIRYKLNIL